MSDSTVLYEANEGVVTITLNRPQAKNALSSALMRDLTSALENASQDESIRVVILTGAGDAGTGGRYSIKTLGSPWPACLQASR